MEASASRPTSCLLVDPGWALARSRIGDGRFDPTAIIAEHAWWPCPAAGPAQEAITRLWRHSVAVAIAARKMAVEADDPDPDAVARAGLLHNLGMWAIAATDPSRLTAWFAAPDGPARSDLEWRWLGCEAADLGRHLAGRWGCEPLVEAAAWLHGDGHGDLTPEIDQPRRLAWIQQAYDRARRTPWAPGDGFGRDPASADPRVRILIAEVQARTGGPWVEPDATAREERLTRENARLRIENARLLAGQEARDRFLEVLSTSSSSDSPATWVERAGLAWCEEPGVAAARVVWADDSPERTEAAASESATAPVRPPSTVIVLGEPHRPTAQIQLWRVDTPEHAVPAGPHPARAAWAAWSREVEERSRLRRRLDIATRALRKRAAAESETRRLALVEGLAEFAAGAGHELNNPLAVILGRAQLVMGRVEDTEARRSLQAIITQAQRAHRILRDLMYVARPPEPRVRACQPDEIVRACIRDLQPEAEARGILLTAESREANPRAWGDPDAIRQLADILVRNALEATPSGGAVHFLAGGDGKSLKWVVRDNGRGIGADEGARIFDPFFCGRQAGRGLGLGLPRAARIIDRVGGELRWNSAPGLGTNFKMTYPVLDSAPIESDLRPGPSNGSHALPNG
ncbi:ATP-binding protein [Tundrisphaera sp. TA3]|uniref:ATP-binding protein n=1 Tax=Tundrisphaera sp. TA3 TaxID=3435775 RepID=UPI003EBD41E9